MTQYNDRTPETIKAELAETTNEGVEKLALFLQKWMANAHNARNFVEIAEDKTQSPSDRAKLIFGHAYDWFAYGN